MAAIQAAAYAMRIGGDTALHTSDSATQVHDDTLHQQRSDAIQLKDGSAAAGAHANAAATRPSDAMQLNDGSAAAGAHANAAATQPSDALQLNDGSAAAGAHANAAATQPRSASRYTSKYINRTAAKITTQPSTSTAQSISQRIGIGFGLSASAMRALKPNTAMPHTRSGVLCEPL